MIRIIIMLFFTIIILLVYLKYMNKIEHFDIVDWAESEVKSGASVVESKIIDPVKSTIETKVVNPVESVREKGVAATLGDTLLTRAKNKLMQKIISLPYLNGKLTTQDVDPIMSEFFSIEKIQQLDNDPDTYFDNLMNVISGSDKIINLLLSLGKTKIISILSPIFQSNNLSIDKLEPALDLLDSKTSLVNIETNPKEFMVQLMTVSKPLFLELSTLVLREGIDKLVPDSTSPSATTTPAPTPTIDYNKYPSVIDFGTSSKLESLDGIDNNGCINNLSLVNAKEKCNSSSSCNGFYIYDTTNPSRVCFKSEIDTTKQQKKTTSANSSFFVKN